MSAAQLAAFLAWSKDHSQLHPMWHTLAMTGMRRGELLALRWKDVDLDAATITVRRSADVIKVLGEPARTVEGTTKSGRSRVVDLDAETVAVLHDLRHGHVTGLLQAGVPVHVVARRAGHASPVVTMTVYAHVMKGDQQSAASAFAARVAGAGGS